MTVQELGRSYRGSISLPVADIEESIPIARDEEVTGLRNSSGCEQDGAV